jgi:xanthine dehydrogenase accessory factor
MAQLYSCNAGTQPGTPKTCEALTQRDKKHHLPEGDWMNAAMAQAGLTLMQSGAAFALVTIVDSEGSSPRHVGASMVVKGDGAITGTVGGGALEAAAIKKALHVLETQQCSLMDYELTNADPTGLGMICGGHGVVLLEYIAPTDVVARGIYTALLDLLVNSRQGWVLNVLTEPHDGPPRTRTCLVDSDGIVAGDIEWPAEAVKEAVKTGRAPTGEAGQAPARVYVRPVGGRGTAYVFGAGHCGEKLVPVLSMLGFITVVIDDRREFANAERFPSADRIVVPDTFVSSIEQLALGPDSYAVIMTRGHVHDRDVLRGLLRTRAGYIGMIGSKRKVAQTFEALVEEGVSAEDIARVHAPIGLPIAAETPEEIAVSIAAQLIQVRANLGA